MVSTSHQYRCNGSATQKLQVVYQHRCYISNNTTAAATILIIDTANIAQQQQRCPPLSPIALTQITESEICAHVHTRCIFDVAGLPNEMGIVVSWFELLGRMVIDQMYLPIVVRTFAH